MRCFPLTKVRHSPLSPFRDAPLVMARSFSHLRFVVGLMGPSSVSGSLRHRFLCLFVVFVSLQHVVPVCLPELSRRVSSIMPVALLHRSRRSHRGTRGK